MSSVGTYSHGVGTPAYMAPELLHGPLVLNPNERRKQFQHYNAKVDAWSFGVVFYQLYFGQLPCRTEESIAADVNQIEDDKLRCVIRKLLRENPDERHYLHNAYKLRE